MSDDNDDNNPISIIDYPSIVQDAMREVIPMVLTEVELHGTMPGEHCIYIGFLTDYPGVKISKALKLQFPRKMLIVLQHQFDNLVVDDEEFSITIYMNSKAEHLVIPYQAIVSFADHYVDFGLHFEPYDYGDFQDEEKPSSGGDEDSSLVSPDFSAKAAPKQTKSKSKRAARSSDGQKSTEESRKKTTSSKAKAEKLKGKSKSNAVSEASSKAEDDALGSQNAKVISLDSFRNKSD